MAGQPGLGRAGAIVAGLATTRPGYGRGSRLSPRIRVGTKDLAGKFLPAGIDR